MTQGLPDIAKVHVRLFVVLLVVLLSLYSPTSYEVSGGGGLPLDKVFHRLAGAPGSKMILDPAVKDLFHLIIGPCG